MRLFGWTVLGLAVAALFACTEVLRAGRCNQTSDCAAMQAYGAGYVCNNDLTLQGDGRCVPRCQSSSECTDGRVCDFDGQGVGRCLFPETPDGGGGDGGGDDSDAAGDTQHCPVCQGTTAVCVGVTCVECATSADCKSDPTKPICDTTAHTCGACSSDDQCAAKLGAAPGVCMAHQDGRCATGAEAIYVDPTATTCLNILSTPNDGTAAAPFCTLDLARRVLNGDGSIQPTTRTLLIIRGGTMEAAAGPITRPAGSAEVSIVGQTGVVIAAGAKPGFDFQSGAFYVRGLKISPSASVGIKATPATSGALTLRLDRVTIDSCQGGGILLDGAAFDIVNTTITRNGPGDDGGLPWGGVRIRGVASTGPKQIALSTISMNDGGGVSCAGPIDGAGDVLVVGNVNTPVQVSNACGFQPCITAGPTCGASP